MTDASDIETEELVIASKSGKKCTYNIPLPPKGFKNGKKLATAVKRFVKANHSSRKADCSRLVNKLKDVFCAPEVEWINFEITFVRNRTWGYNPKCRVHMCGCTPSGDPWGRFGKGTASGAGYDKPSAALDRALCDKELECAWDRIIIENYDKLVDTMEGTLLKNVMDDGKDYCCIPELDLAGRGLSEMEHVMRVLGWTEVNRVDGENFRYGEYTKHKKKAR